MTDNIDFAGRTVLIVDDNELNANVAGIVLESVGMTIEYAFNGKEAVDKVAEKGNGYYDLILMDIMMPIMNGYEAARAIRGIHSEYTDNIPIFAITANSLSEDVELSYEAGMNEYIIKPINYSKLAGLLKKYI